MGVPLFSTTPNNARLAVGPIPTPNGVRISGAEIIGLLDLADGSSHDENCTSLVLRNCDLPGDIPKDKSSPGKPLSIDAKHIRLKRLAITDCKFHGLDLTGMSLDGDFDFSGAKPYETNGDCWVVARDARIDGTIRAAHTELSRNDLSSVHRDQAFEYALDLKGVEVTGSLQFFPEFMAKGGVTVASAKVSGDLWMLGANVSIQAPGTIALSAQMAKIDGVAAFRADSREKSPQPFLSNGHLDLYQATVGVLDLSGAQLISLNAHMAEIRGDLRMGEFSTEMPLLARGEIRLSNASIGGNVFIHSAAIQSFEGRHLTIGGDLSILSVQIQSLDGRHLKTCGDVTLHGVFRDVDFSEACIDGSLELGAYKHFGPTDGLKVDIREPDAHGTPKPPLRFPSSKIGRLNVSAPIRVQEPPSSKPTAIRTRRLACYPEWMLGEALYEDGEEYLVGSFLINTDHSSIIILPGSSNPIHWFNKKFKTKLLEEQVKDYLRFFCANVWGENGAFRIIEKDAVRPEDAPLKDSAVMLTVEKIEKDEAIRPEDTALKDSTVALTPEKNGVSWKAEASLVYSGAMFKATFEVTENGVVVMLKDEQLDPLPLDQVKYEPPFRRVTLKGYSKAGKPAWPLSPVIRDCPNEWIWRDATSDEEHEEALRSLNALVDEQKRSQPSSVTLGSRVGIDLRGAHTGTLDDVYGTGWGENVHLHLEDFLYDQLLVPLPNRLPPTRDKVVGTDFQRSADKSSTPPIGRMKEDEVMEHRAAWLRRQYESTEGWPKRDEYSPQPFELLTQRLRGLGYHEAADHIVVQQREIERRLLLQKLSVKTGLFDLFAVFLNKLFELCFQYGLSFLRASITSFIFILVGYLGVEIANYGYVRYPPWNASERPPPAWVPSILRLTPRTNPILIIDSTPVSAFVLQDQRSGDAPTDKLVSQRTSDPQTVVEEVACREQVDSLWYAIDVAMPVLDLKQESKCAISSRADALAWRVAKQFYALFGALITALTILTASGILRRYINKSS